MDCRTTPVRNVCEEQELDSFPLECPPFSLCVPFMGQLAFDGECIRYDAAAPIEDGEYGIVVVEGGCVTGLRKAPVPIYTPGPCAPDPLPCEGGTGGGGVSLNPDACNLSSLDAAGRLNTRTFFESGTGTSVAGCGTIGSPFRVNVDLGDTATYIGTASPDAITISGVGSQQSPYMIRQVSKMTPGTYLGLTVDEYGAITAYNPEAASGVLGLVEGPGISLLERGGVYTISLPVTGVPSGTYALGGFDVTYDLTGRAVDIVQAISIPSGTYDLSLYAVTLNAYGSITALSNTDKRPVEQFSRMFSPGRTETSMTFETLYAGSLRVIYRGNLGPGTTMTPGLTPAPPSLLIDVNGQTAQGFVKLESGQITELHILTTAVYGPGTHNVSIFLADEQAIFTDTGIMDVLLVTQGD